MRNSPPDGAEVRCAEHQIRVRCPALSVKIQVTVELQTEYSEESKSCELWRNQLKRFIFAKIEITLRLKFSPIV